MARMRATSRFDMEVRRYPVLVYGLVPLIALVLQAWLPRMLGRFVWFDLPLIVTVYFALGRRSPIQGMVMGGIMGLFEDALSGRPIGINGIAKTVCGFLAASVGIRVDVENNILRLALNFLLSLLSSAIYLFVYRYVMAQRLDWNWVSELLKAVGNSAIALMIFPLLDKLQLHD